MPTKNAGRVSPRQMRELRAMTPDRVPAITPADIPVWSDGQYISAESAHRRAAASMRYVDERIEARLAASRAKIAAE